MKQNKTQLIDLSHTITGGLITYKGLPAPIICDYLTRDACEGVYEEGTTFQIGKIEMISNTGTYIDTPFHRFAEGKDLSEIDLDGVANLDGIVISINENIKEITAEMLQNHDIKDKAVLIHTNWSRHWGSDAYFENDPYLTENAAIYLKQQGVKLVGIDCHNIDDTTGKTRPVHTVLLHNEIFIVEHMTNLSQLPKGGFKFYAVPIKIKGMGTFPIRAFAQIG
ncbi:MAG: cyclase family protein [Proteobacteria bacterium]|nr:cyclase family protein [Pseudomonadota bacterium]